MTTDRQDPVVTLGRALGSSDNVSLDDIKTVDLSGPQYFSYTATDKRNKVHTQWINVTSTAHRFMAILTRLPRTLQTEFFQALSEVVPSSGDMGTFAFTYRDEQVHFQVVRLSTKTDFTLNLLVT